MRIGLVLTGGGARAAYQIGVLAAIARMTPPRAKSPFEIVCGTSAGAFNAAAIAAGAADFRGAVHALLAVWKNFHTAHVYRSDALGIAASGARWLAALMLGGLGRHNPASLLDNAPLAALLAQVLDFEGIPRAIESGALHGLAITASSYDTGHSTTFFQGGLSPEGWKRARRIGVPATIGIPHLMASAAMPFIFPAVRVDDQHYGDGSMRQVAPLSPALHLGAERLLVISVGRIGARGAAPPAHAGYPSLAQIGGHALTSIFFDALEADLEQLQRINQAVDLIGNGADGAMRDAAGTRLRKVEHLLLTPSRALDAMAGEYLRSIPRPVRYFLRGIGAMRASGSNLASFLLFEKSYTRAVIRLGYADTMARREAVAKLLGLDAAPARRRDAAVQPPPSARSPSSAP